MSLRLCSHSFNCPARAAASKIKTRCSAIANLKSIRRLRNDLRFAIAEHRVLIFDAAARAGQLNEWEQSRKLIFVAKKHPGNLQNLHRVLLTDHPGLRNKRVMVIDDEADFASVGYERRRGALQMRTIQR